VAKDTGVFRHESNVSSQRTIVYRVFALATLLLIGPQLAAQETAKTVIGPRNVYLADGADALIAGDAERGVRLTLQALDFAHGSRETKFAHANLCAGYAMLDKPLTALEHCNWVLERDPNYWRAYNNRAIVYLKLGRYEESEADVARGQALQPGSNNLKIVKGMLLDETHPVTEQVEIDERRSSMDDGEDSDTSE
jgi:tetratricopeptide (TPR) repeat protein